MSAIYENERRIAFNFLDAKLDLLTARITTAKAVDLTIRPKDEIRFGESITLEVNDAKKSQNYQIVGMDEANIRDRKISCISSMAQLLIHKKVAEKVILNLADRNRISVVKAIEYG